MWALLVAIPANATPSPEAPAPPVEPVMASHRCRPDPSMSVEFDGVKFPQGVDSFADEVIRYVPGRGVSQHYGDAQTALGPPDWVEGVGAVSLGNRKGKHPAELVVAFNKVYVADVPGPDLYVFEVGPIVEPTEVAVSVDGDVWVEIGVIEGSTRAIDLADHGVFTPDTRLRFVRLRDAANRPSRAPYAGADIDAIGAIGACRFPNS
jgi:hypothetical protein